MILLETEQHWVCPNCSLTQVTRESQPHTRMHACSGLNGITAPMIPDGVNCKVEVVEREDYVGKEVVTYDDANKPISAVVTTRDDGNDVAVFAPVAVANFRDVS